jgi:hypothetical protein
MDGAPHSQAEHVLVRWTDNVLELRRARRLEVAQYFSHHKIRLTECESQTSVRWCQPRCGSTLPGLNVMTGIEKV